MELAGDIFGGGGAKITTGTYQGTGADITIPVPKNTAIMFVCGNNNAYWAIRANGFSPFIGLNLEYSSYNGQFDVKQYKYRVGAQWAADSVVISNGVLTVSGVTYSYVTLGT